MSSTTLPWKVYGPSGALIGATVFAEDAAILVSAQSAGARVEADKCIVWREKSRPVETAGDSYDAAADAMRQRRQDNTEARHARFRQAMRAR